MDMCTSHDILEMTMCNTEEKYHELACIERECGNCGVNKLMNKYGDVVQNHGNKEISWYEWSSVSTTHRDKQVNKTMLVKKTGPFNDFCESFTEKLKPHTGQKFVAAWQSDQCDLCIKTMDVNEATMMMDYAENYSCRHRRDSVISLGPKASDNPSNDAVLLHKGY